MPSYKSVLLLNFIAWLYDNQSTMWVCLWKKLVQKCTRNVRENFVNELKKMKLSDRLDFKLKIAIFLKNKFFPWQFHIFSIALKTICRSITQQNILRQPSPKTQYKDSIKNFISHTYTQRISADLYTCTFEMYTNIYNMLRLYGMEMEKKYHNAMTQCQNIKIIRD